MRAIKLGFPCVWLIGLGACHLVLPYEPATNDAAHLDSSPYDSSAPDSQPRDLPVKDTKAHKDDLLPPDAAVPDGPLVDLPFNDLVPPLDQSQLDLPPQDARPHDFPPPDLAIPDLAIPDLPVPDHSAGDSTADGLECPPEQIPCAGECVDLFSDPQHCGECNAPCPEPTQSCRIALCQEGSCQEAMAEDGALCPEGLCLLGNCCSGCIKGDSCLIGDDQEACGSSGQACIACPKASECASWTCNPVDSTKPCLKQIAPAGSACTDGICIDGSCCSGCFIKLTDDKLACHAGNSVEACGRKGEECQTCTEFEATCNEGTCMSIALPPL